MMIIANVEPCNDDRDDHQADDRPFFPKRIRYVVLENILCMGSLYKHSGGMKAEVPR